MTAGRYTVRAGDTLQSIALQVWGDSSLWYVLADANGMDSSTELAEGMSLVIPNKVENIHNNVSTFKPYDPNRAIGNILPSPIPPTQARRLRCSPDLRGRGATGP